MVAMEIEAIGLGELLDVGMPGLQMHVDYKATDVG